MQPDVDVDRMRRAFVFCPEQDGMRSRIRLLRPSDRSRPEFNKRCA